MTKFDYKDYCDGNEFCLDVNKTFHTAGDGFWSDAEREVFVTYIYMAFDSDGWASDFRVNFDSETWDTHELGLIYTDSLFIKELQDYLLKLGMDKDVVEDIGYSEQGMQGDEHVSCDAYAFADAVREAFGIVEQE